MAVPAIPTTPTLTCPGKVPVAVVLVYAQDPLIPLIPISGAEVQFSFYHLPKVWEVIKITKTTDSAGFAQACIDKMEGAVTIDARKSDVDFGNGKGKWTTVGKPMVYLSPIIVGPFKSKTAVPCTSGTFPISQNLSQPGIPKPQVWSGTLPITAAGYNIPATGMPFTIYINDIEIGSGTMPGNQLVFTSLKPVTDIPNISSLLGKSVEIKAVIKFGTCEWVGKTTVSLPVPVCPPGEVLDPITKTCIKIVCPPGEVLDPITKTCIKIVCPPGQYLDPYTKTCKPIPIGEVCEIGDEQTVTCPDGTIIVTAKCQKDPVTGKNRWVPTGKTCPLPPIGEVCEIGDEQTITCPDGTIIVTAKCQKDPVTGKNRWVPTGTPCPPLELPKTVEILTYPKGASLEAFDGQDVTITAAVMCGASPSSGENATLIVDAAKTAFGTTSGGFVSFKWKATVEPSRTHKICVSVPKSSACPKFGDATDCKIITVSRVIPSVTEQLLKEREAYLAELEAKRKERERIRELTLLAATPILPPITPPVLTGFIFIPSVPKPVKIPYPVNISIDGAFVGSPPVKEAVDPGIHMILAELRGMAPIYKKISIKSGDTLTITDIAFIEEPLVPPPYTPPGPYVPPPYTPPGPYVPPPYTPPGPYVPPPITPPVTPPPGQGVISIPSIPVPPFVPYPITIEINGEPVGSPPLNIYTSSGTYYITISLKGFTPISKKITVKSGETINISGISFGG